MISASTAPSTAAEPSAPAGVCQTTTDSIPATTSVSESKPITGSNTMCPAASEPCTALWMSSAESVFKWSGYGARR